MNLPDRSPRVRVRKDRWMSLAAAGVLGLLAGAPAWALRPVQVYEVTVRGATAANVVTEGMKQALLRATGRRDAAANPQLNSILLNAAQYLQGTRVLPGGAVQVDFNGA